MSTTEQTKKVHHGRNIKRFREMFGLKQEGLALELGDEWSQKKVSRLEDNPLVEDEILEQIAKVLKIPVEAIKNFSEEAAVNFFNTFHDTTINGAGSFSSHNYDCTFNSIEKFFEMMDENKKLHEQLLASEREKNALLQKMLDQKR